MSNSDLIDELVAKATPPRTTKRKGTDPIRAKEKKPSGKLPAMVEEGTRAHAVAELIRKGHSISDISQEYGISNSEIKSIVVKALQEIYDDAAPVVLNWVWINIRRLEDMIKIVLPKVVDDDDVINDPMMDRLQSLIRQQMEIINMAMPKGGDSNKGQGFNTTISSDSPLHSLGHKEMNEQRLLPDEAKMTEREAMIADLDDPIEGGIVYMEKP